MARQICQGGPGDTRLGAMLGGTQLSPGISSRCHLSDESRANGIVFPSPHLWPALPLCRCAILHAALCVPGTGGKHIHATMLLGKCIVGSGLRFILECGVKTCAGLRGGREGGRGDVTSPPEWRRDNSSHKIIDSPHLKQIMLHFKGQSVH